MTTGINTVLEVLEEYGYERLPRPLTVAGTELDFEAAARGTGVSHDLVVVATSDAPRPRLLRLVTGLTRALDQSESRRPVSLVLLGEIASAERVELERHARVLRIESANPDHDEVRQGVAVLLPLALPLVASRGRDPLEEVLVALGGSATAEHLSLVQAARGGEDEVRASLQRFVDSAVQGDEGGSTS